MADIYPPAKQREALLKFAEALGCRDNALRRDECSDWAIFGKRGHIYGVPGSLDRPATPGFQILVMGWTARGWNLAKETLKPFADLTNDGDDEGAFFLDRLPTPAEAEAIRHYLGIAKKAEYSDEVLAQKREAALKARQQIGQKTPSDAPAAPSAAEAPAREGRRPGSQGRGARDRPRAS
jgi:hypothetical protein